MYLDVVKGEEVAEVGGVGKAYAFHGDQIVLHFDYDGGFALPVHIEGYFAAG